MTTTHIDKNGRQIVTVTGSFDGDDAAEQYRGFLRSRPAACGFMRSQSYRLSQDTRTLTFVITDSEIPPPGFGGAA